jgi:hypothetical protein
LRQPLSARNNRLLGTVCPISVCHRVTLLHNLRLKPFPIPEIHVDQAWSDLHIETVAAGNRRRRVHRPLQGAGVDGFDRGSGEELTEKLRLPPSQVVEFDIRAAAEYLFDIPPGLAVPYEYEFQFVL